MNSILLEALTQTPTVQRGVVGETDLVLNGNDFRLYWFGSLDESEMSSERVLDDTEQKVCAEVGTDDRLADPEPLTTTPEACERTAIRPLRHD